MFFLIFVICRFSMNINVQPHDMSTCCLLPSKNRNWGTCIKEYERNSLFLFFDTLTLCCLFRTTSISPEKSNISPGKSKFYVSENTVQTTFNKILDKYNMQHTKPLQKGASPGPFVQCVGRKNLSHTANENIVHLQSVVCSQKLQDFLQVMRSLPELKSF